MEDLDVLARDFGYKPSGKSAPMRSDGGDRRNVRSSSSFVATDQTQKRNGDDTLFSDVFGGPAKFGSSNDNKAASMRDFDYESIFKSSSSNETRNKSTSSLPVYDKPVYDDDIFDGLPGLKSKSTSVSTMFDDDVFKSKASSSPPPKQSDHYDDLLWNFGTTDKPEPKNNEKSPTNFDDLLPGFGGGSSTGDRKITESGDPKNSGGISNQATTNAMDDPFVVLQSTSSAGLFSNPLDDFSEISKHGNTKTDTSSVSAGVFEDLDPLGAFSNSVPSFSSNVAGTGKSGSPIRSRSTAQASSSDDSVGKSSSKYAESSSQKIPADRTEESQETVFGMRNDTKEFGKSVDQNVDSNYNETNSQSDVSTKASEHVQHSDDVWLTVSEIPLFTEPTRSPPPSRPPPPIPQSGLKTKTGSFTSSTTKKANEFNDSYANNLQSQSPKHTHPAAKDSVVFGIDELENFTMLGTRSRSNVDEIADEEANMNTAAAAMIEAMSRAESKFRHAKEVRERETRAARSREFMQQERDEEVRQNSQEREFRENQERLDNERRKKEREVEEMEQRRIEREREIARERAREIEREKARQAVERANREARERAMAEARERAAAEARLRAEKAAVQRAQAEARERAANDARERAERAAAEARERAAAEARERANAEAREKEAREKAAAAKADLEARRKADRAAAERVAAEARERAAAAAAAAAKMNQQSNDNDLESFFSMGSRPSSAPRPRTNSSDSSSDPLFQSRGPEVPRRTTPSNAASSMRKASSTTNIVDDLTSIFGATPSSGEFQEFDGESEERRRARLDRHQRTQERAAKALAEKNQRDLQTQREQEERNRISEALDFEIKRWAAGKEGNLRAMLSTLQYVLWPECGWQPVSLTDLITGASVKKVYRKATLCIHPDKVQQKGATLQQKYVAEKVFDLLKEAWNKFNSEELF